MRWWRRPKLEPDVVLDYAYEGYEAVTLGRTEDGKFIHLLITGRGWHGERDVWKGSQNVHPIRTRSSAVEEALLQENQK